MQNKDKDQAQVNEQYYGFWSDSQFACVKQFCYYLTPGGEIVRVTEVLKGKDKKSNWNDSSFVSVVGICIGSHDKISDDDPQESAEPLAPMASALQAHQQDTGDTFKFQMYI